MITVPYLSQLELNETKGWNNCGPACLTMQLAWAGCLGPTIESQELHDTADYVRNGYYDGDYWYNGYTDYPLMQTLVSYKYKLTSRILTNWGDVYKTLEAGVPVQLLVYDVLLQPRQFPTGWGWDANHFILLTGYGGKVFTVNDPLAYWTRAPGYYNADSVWSAVAKVGGVYALAVYPATLESEEDLRVIAEVQAKVDELVSTNSALNIQVHALRAEVDGLNGQNTERQSQIDDLHSEVEGLTVEVERLQHLKPHEVAPAYITCIMPSGQSFTFDDPVP